MRTQLAALLMVWLFAQPAGAQCGGVERWPVKVGSDAGASLVALANPVSRLLLELTGLQRPQLPSDDDTRLPEERTVYALDARLVKFKLESGRTGDRDYHLVISDDTLQFSQGASESSHSLVAEIVDPNCVPGRHGSPSTTSVFASQLAAVRAKFEQRFPNISGGWNEAGGIPVHLLGVGFFDRAHGQTGRSPNGLEIHPILDIDFGAAPSPSASTLLVNPDFESGAQGWTATPDVISSDTSEPSHGGTWKAWLGGYGTAHSDKIWQQVTLPSTTSVTLSFWLHISTEEQEPAAYDKLKINIRATNGQLIKTLKTLSNQQAAAGFSLKTFDLTPYAGQTIRLELAATEDNGSMTSFVVDDFRIGVE